LSGSIVNFWKKRVSGIYYGYIVLAACFFIMVVVYGAQNSFGVFFKPMLNEFGWSRAETSGPFALYMVVSGLLSFVSGRLSDKFGAQKVVAAGGLFLGIGYLLTSRITSLWQLYLYYGVLVAAGSSAMYVPPVSMITRWFSRRRGLMSGIGISGIGFGIGVVPALASQLIASYSWRISLLVVGGVSLVFLVLLARLLKNRPQKPVQDESLPVSGIACTSEIREYTFKEAVRTRHFWLFFIAWIFYGFFANVGLVHIVPYATDLGMAAVAAASVLTVIGLVGTFGRIGLGLAGDRFGKAPMISVSFALMAAVFFGLSISHTISMLYIFAVIFGALSGTGILFVPIIADYYGYKELGTISGAIVFANCMGGAISPPLAGGIFDATGSYLWAFISCGILGTAAAVMVLLLKPTQNKA
jgi:MFS family permease